MSQGNNNGNDPDKRNGELKATSFLSKAESRNVHHKRCKKKQKQTKTEFICFTHLTNVKKRKTEISSILVLFVPHLRNKKNKNWMIGDEWTLCPKFPKPSWMIGDVVTLCTKFKKPKK